MSKQRPIHQFTEFDLTCEEKNEYDKTYGSDLSYGYYSAYKATNKLPKEWYEYLEEVKKISKKDSKLDRLEYQEYLRKTHKKTNFPKYCKLRDEGKLRPKWWYGFLKKCLSSMPKNFTEADAEYREYCQMFNDHITYFEYYAMKAEDNLPSEWYVFLIQLEKSIIELEQSY